MKTSKDYMDLAEKALSEAKSILNEADSIVETDPERAKELDTQAKRHLDDKQTFEEKAELRKTMEEQDLRDQARRLDTAQEERGIEFTHSRGESANRSTDHLNESVTADALQERNRLNRLMHVEGVRALTEEEAKKATKRFPQESLFGLRLLEIKKRDMFLTHEERSSWMQYQEVAERVAANSGIDSATTGQSTNPTKGGDLVPEDWANEIFSSMAYSGPLADFSRVRVFDQAGTNTFHLPIVSDAQTKKAVEVNEGADMAFTTFNTKEETLVPRKRGIITPLTVELIASTSFRSWLVSEVGTILGRKINEELTTGSGANQAKGVMSITGNDQETTTTTKPPIEADIIGLLNKIDYSYLTRPSTVFMAHAQTVLNLTILRDSVGGNRVFPLSMDRSSILLPYGIPVLPNNAITADLTANNFIGSLGDLDRYVVVRGLGMRVDSQFWARSDQWELAWKVWYDGTPTFDHAFARLKAK